MAITSQSGSEVEVTPAVTAGSYTAGYVVGGAMHFVGLLPLDSNGILESLTLKFAASVQTTEFDVAIFSGAPAGTFADHGAPSIAAADSLLLVGSYQLTNPQSQLGAHTIYCLDAIGKQIDPGTTDLWAVVTTKSAPVNPASTSDMSLRIGVVK